MANVAISGLTAAGTLTGKELFEVSQLSTTVKITATTLSAQASDNSYNDSALGFGTAGFAVGDRVRVEGFTGNAVNNIMVGVITALTTGKMTIGGTDGDVIVDDAAGESVTISKWLTRRLDLAAVATYVGGASTDYRNTVASPASASGTLTLDYSAGDFHTTTLTENVTTLAFSNLPGSGKAASLMLRIQQHASSPKTFAWPASFKWEGGAAPTISSTNSAVDLLSITTFDNGTTWHATLSKGRA